jgi:hypothetical protein
MGYPDEGEPSEFKVFVACPSTKVKSVIMPCSEFSGDARAALARHAMDAKANEVTRCIAFPSASKYITKRQDC